MSPINALRYGWSRLVPRNAVVGFRLFDRPLLASYSRSGTNWTRYIIEYLSGAPTPGRQRLHSGTNYHVDRAHCAYPIMHRYNKVLLIVRDYRECILRQHREIWPTYASVAALLADETVTQPTNWYIKNIAAFDEFQGQKVLIHYEDLIQSPVHEIEKITTFLRLSQEKSIEFIESLEFHFQASVNSYVEGGGSSETSTTRDTTLHARTHLSRRQIAEFDDYYFSQYSDLASKYLTRYDTRSQVK